MANKVRAMKKSKAKRAAKKAQRKTTYDPNVKSKYSQKKAQQAKGKYSANSPFTLAE